MIITCSYILTCIETKQLYLTDKEQEQTQRRLLIFRNDRYVYK